VIGPGLIIALALSVFLVWRRVQPPQVARPVVIQHEGAIAATGVPDPPFVLAHAEALKLSADQRTRVRQLAEAYGKQTAARRKALDQAEQDARQKLSQAPGRTPSPTDIEDASRGVAELSGLLAEARVAAWPGLCAVLTAEQQQQARQAWAEAHTLRMPQQKREGGG
jgi:hypothetical protein